MKRKDIEKKLKIEAEQFVPDPLDKIKMAARAEKLLPYDSELNSEVYSQGNTAVMAKSKRKAIWSFTAFASIFVCFILILSFTLNFEMNTSLNPTQINLSTEDVYGMGAVSSVRLLGSYMSSSAVKTFSEVNSISYTTSNHAVVDKSEDDAKRQAKRFNEYFTALDSFLGDDIISTTTEVNTDDNYEYEMKMTIKGKDFNGETVTYTMYYTETLAKADSAVDEDPSVDEDSDVDEDADDDNNDADIDENADEDEDTDVEEEETENEYHLVGVMVIDGTDYYLEGERSEESEKDESETELKIRAYADKTDKTSYIQMEQEHSVEDGETETEYVYSIYANGELIEQTAVEFETENKNNKIETEYELEFRSGTSKGKYVVKREVKDNKISIKVKYNIDGKTGVFHIREITDENGNRQYEYTFSDNEIIVF